MNNVVRRKKWERDTHSLFQIAMIRGHSSSCQHTNSMFDILSEKLIYNILTVHGNVVLRMTTDDSFYVL